MIVERKKVTRSLKTLTRRHDWLSDRVVLSKKDLSFDKSERLALQIVITILEGLMQGQKVEAQGGIRTGTNLEGYQASTHSAHVPDKEGNN